MEQLNKEFCVPYYIFEEIVDYVELTAKGYSKCMKWENIKAPTTYLFELFTEQRYKNQSEMVDFLVL